MMEEAPRRNKDLQKVNEDLRRTFQEQPRQVSDGSAGRRRRADP